MEERKQKYVMEDKKEKSIYIEAGKKDKNENQDIDRERKW